jgi:hypothetical protein
MCRCVTFRLKKIKDLDTIRKVLGYVWTEYFDYGKLSSLVMSGFVKSSNKVIKCQYCGFLLNIEDPAHLRLVKQSNMLFEIHDQECKKTRI